MNKKQFFKAVSNYALFTIKDNIMENKKSEKNFNICLINEQEYWYNLLKQKRKSNLIDIYEYGDLHRMFYEMFDLLCEYFDYFYFNSIEDFELKLVEITRSMVIYANHYIYAD